MPVSFSILANYPILAIPAIAPTLPRGIPDWRRFQRHHPISSGSIYLTHMLIYCVIFAIFLLLSVRCYAKRTETDAPVFSHERALTTNHLPVKGDSWLQTSLNQTSEFSGSPRQRARSLPKWNYPSRPITASSKLSFRTKPLSRSILNRVCKSPLSWSVGSLAVTNLSNAGDLFTVSNNFSNLKPEPVERRVLFFPLECFWPDNIFVPIHSNPVRSIATHVSVAATIFLAGTAAVSRGYVIFGLALMGFAVLYLIYELVASKPIRNNVPGMFRLLIAIFAVAIFMGLNRDTIKGFFSPSPTPTPSPSPSPTSTPIAQLEARSKPTATPSQAAVATATPTSQADSHPSASEIAEELAKRLRGNQPQLHIIKEKAIDLADEIAQFAKQRDSLVATAQFFSGQTGQQIQNQMNAIRQGSPAVFDTRFSQRIQESISDLKRTGIYTGGVEETCQHVMHMTIANCGDELRKAANKIPASVSSFDSLPVKKLLFTQEPTNSTRDDAPYAVKVVIQTNVTIKPVSIVVKCDSEATSGDFRMAGTYTFINSGYGYTDDDKRNFWFHFNDEFKPETPITALIMSAHPIKALAVMEVPYH